MTVQPGQAVCLSKSAVEHERPRSMTARDGLAVGRDQSGEVFRGCRVQRHAPTLLRLVSMSSPSSATARSHDGSPAPPLLRRDRGPRPRSLAAALVGGAAAAPADRRPGAGGALGRACSCGWSTTWRRGHQVGLLMLAAFLAPETTRTNRRITATRAGQRDRRGVGADRARRGAVHVRRAGRHTAVRARLPRPSSRRSSGSSRSTRVARHQPAGLAAVVAVGAAVARTRVAMAWLAAPGRGRPCCRWRSPVTPPGAANHDTAVNALAVHLVGVVVWVGGLLALAVMRPAARLGPRA